MYSRSHVVFHHQSPVNDLQSAARLGDTAPSCALLAAGAASDEPREVRMIGKARGEIKQSSHGQGSPSNRGPEGREAFLGMRS